MQHALAALLLLLAVAARAQPTDWQARAGLKTPLAPGQATVTNGQELLEALADGVGDITLAGDIVLTPADMQQFDLPFNLNTSGAVVLLHSAKPGQQAVLDWNYALEAVNVLAGSTLAFDDIVSKNPGNRTKALDSIAVPLEVRSAIAWPTISGEPGHTEVYTNTFAWMDTPDCNPDFVKIEVDRLQKMLNRTDTITYLGGVGVHYSNITYPGPITDLTTRQQVGVAMITFNNVTTECYDSAFSDGSSSDGTPSWVWAVVGTVAGLALVAVLVAVLWWRRRRRKRAQQAAAADDYASKHSSQEAGILPDLHSSGLPSNLVISPLGSGGLYGGSGGGMHSGSGGEMQSTWLRTRFGVIDGVQLGELLGRGAFGRVYKGRWEGAIVAVKVIDHAVQPGKTYDLSREPLLSMSVSHPNICTCHKMCVVRIAGPQAEAAAAEARPKGGGSSGTEGGGSSGSGGHQLVPAISGSGGMVQVVSPHEVLQPGMYETWLITELCDRGSLAGLISGSKLPGDPTQREIWVLLCLLDIAQGLGYLHTNNIVHGDLKPGNVLLKSARNDRRGFICKLGDFGLSRFLGHEQTHVDTANFGTASYAAPELLSDGKLTKAADIYSFSLIIWELASGSELYAGMGAMQVIVQVSQYQHRPEVPATCPPDLADLMTRCWSQDATRRPAATEVVQELRRQLQQLRNNSNPLSSLSPATSGPAAEATSPHAPEA